MDDLRIGDNILVFDAETGATRFSPVAFFSTAISNATRRDDDDDEIVYVRAQGWATPLALSHEHLVLVSRSPVDRPEFVEAQDVVAGQHWAWMHRGGALVPARVETMWTARTVTGWYNPKTSAGTIVVDGFAASCYTENHALREVLYAPYTAWLDAFPYEKGATPQEGLHWYARKPAKAGKALHRVVTGALAAVVGVWS